MSKLALETETKKSSLLQLFLIVLVFFLFLSSISLIILPYIITNSRLSELALETRAKDLDNGYYFLDKVDGWGQSIFVRKRIDADNIQIVYTVVSLGKDGILGSSDDMTKSVIDNDKMKIAGELINQRVMKFPGYKKTNY